MSRSKAMQGKETRLYKNDIQQLERDYLREPIVVCEWDKRRKCDSYYRLETIKLIKENVKLKTQIQEMKEELENEKKN